MDEEENAPIRVTASETARSLPVVGVNNIRCS
jgi:hypothetical protein